VFVVVGTFFKCLMLVGQANTFRLIMNEVGWYTNKSLKWLDLFSENVCTVRLHIKYFFFPVVVCYLEMTKEFTQISFVD
jgi:hypothetical protein